ncbi:hypothetical protein [Cellulomonas chengniuliangii]|uniref:ABC transporter permease n=1 Tax=Cellulomonas chengniuliangii TaxID=2968084 RepID=A0ABY5L154_9CELL|nr:hypothetical protein [Cellulomonas chengniuliangii]MCC2308123.1 hypothetical protein [Cellulomonas chengniuliangii]MCC2317131.1 hypothetical protein [Cellulomonas chengniuliangii]UUI76517.1 hypothetical protein NP064_06425 [Cellulomonas chengniuliangii]
MRDIVGAARMRALTGRSWWLLATGGIGVCVLAAAGYATTVTDLPPQEATDGLVGLWFTLLLFSALFAGNVTARDHATGTIARTVLTAGGRDRALAAGLRVSVEIGVVYGLVAAALGAATPWVLLPAAGVDVAWTDSTWAVVLGVFVVTAVAAPWGALLGWLVRSQVATIGILVVQMLLTDELVQRLAPGVGKFGLSMAMASIYGDGRDDLLAVPAAAAVIAVWLAVAAVGAVLLVRRRDVL